MTREKLLNDILLRFPKYKLMTKSKEIKSENYISIKCENNHIWTLKTRKFYDNKNGCPQCQKERKRILYENNFKEFLKENGYELVDSYFTNSKKVKIKHLDCSKIYSVSPSNFYGGKRCPYCSKRNLYFPKKKNDLWFKKKVFNLVGNEYTVLSKYINSETKLKMKHNLCGTEYEITPANFIYGGNRCPLCSKPHLRKTQENFEKEVFEKYGNKFQIVSAYKNNKSKVTIKCNNCKNKFDILPIDLLRKNKIIKCKYCEHKESDGIIKIKNFLNKNRILYVTEIKIDGCKNIRSLPFDFYLPDYSLLIEYDGEQHFYPIYGKKKLLKTIYNDSLKTKFCYENNMDLLRIDFRDLDNIEKILKDYLDLD